MTAAKWVAGSVTAVVIGAALVAPLQSHTEVPYYRVFDGPSWRAASTFANSGAGPDDQFLSHPWQAPVYSALTGAKPWTVLYPGDAPVRGEDWDNYLASAGSTPEWFRQRNIDYVIAPIPPNAPNRELGQGVYQVG